MTAQNDGSQAAWGAPGVPGFSPLPAFQGKLPGERRAMPPQGQIWINGRQRTFLSRTNTFMKDTHSSTPHNLILN